MENPLFVENYFFFPEDMYITNNNELNLAVERDWNLKLRRVQKTSKLSPLRSLR